MTGAEHYAKAEELIEAWPDAGFPSEVLTAAHVHATLALAAATAHAPHVSQHGVRHTAAGPGQYGAPASNDPNPPISIWPV